jgi:hypothetical protein
MDNTTLDPDNVDRVAKLLVDAGQASGFEDAETILRGYRIQILAASQACNEPAWQAALLSVVNAGVRAVHGGVRVVLAEDPPCVIGPLAGLALSHALEHLGAQIDDTLESGVPTIVFAEQPSSEPATIAVYPFAGTWVAGVSPEPVAREHGPTSVPAAVLAGAMAVSECFQRLRGFAPAADRHAAVSLWRPDLDAANPEAEGPPVRELPSEAWLLGLGHLGQAYAWLLSLLPYPSGGSRPLVLQDEDRLSKANQATSLLYVGGEIGARKTRLVESTMAPIGWDTRVVEHRFLGGKLYAPGEPAVVFVGVDNPAARQLLDDSGFPVIFDAGLGAGPDGFLAMSIRRLPGARSSRELWSAAAPPPSTSLSPAYLALAAQSGDRCGVEMLASRTVATAFVGLTAACWSIGGLLRELHGGCRYELVDYTLRSPGKVLSVPAHEQRRARVPTGASAEVQ